VEAGRGSTFPALTWPADRRRPTSESLMDSITDPPPAEVTAELAALQTKITTMVPAKTPDNLLIGTWNIRDFDRIHSGWRSQPGNSPIRDLSNVACIAEIARHFDVLAVQEVRRTAQGLLAMMAALGPGWSYLVTDVADGSAGNNERLTFIFDTSRVTASGLACELVVAADAAGLPAGVLQGQFARTPYAVSFTRGAHAFTLITLHVVYGAASTARVPELTEIANWLARWARSGDAWGQNLIALGDFNIDRGGDPLYQAFTSTGLQPPAQLNLVPRTIFDDPDPSAPPDHRHFYDQIAWFAPGGPTKTAFTLAYTNAGMIDFQGSDIPATSTIQLSWRISDHFPMWCEFSTNNPN
jgi:endonuclease/exonuclease/phosphatase family metal-dependent hydrolase